MRTKLNTYVTVNFAFNLLILSGLFIFSGCRKGNLRQQENNSERISNQTLVSEYQAFIKYRSFQNPDSTWGFTVFVNSRPYLHYKKIPFNNYESGFLSKSDAEKVAALFVKKVRDGYTSPKLNKRTFDSLGIQKNITK